MPTPQSELCEDWDLTWEDAAGCCAPKGLDTLSAERQAGYLRDAMEFLWRRTGRQYGICQAVITTANATCPIHGAECGCGELTSWWTGAGLVGPVMGWRSNGRRLELPDLGPVRSVDEITLNGVTLVEGEDFTILNRSTLLKSSGRWPCWGDIEITYTYGQVPPRELLNACGVLAVNHAQRCCGCPCSFPEQTKTISAEGMTITVDNPVNYYLDGDLSGIRQVDEVIHALWPYGATSGPGATDPASMTSWDTVTPSLDVST